MPPPEWVLALLDVAGISAIAWIGGMIMQRLRQPRIAGEMAAVFAAGLLLGGQIAGVVPGQDAGGRIAALFPETALGLVTIVGQLGLVLYMLLVGITIDPAPMRRRAGSLVVLSAATIGAMVALALVVEPVLGDAAGWKPPGVSRSAFVLAFAAALAANGLPIVARIIEDRGMTHGAVGSVVIVAAALTTALALIAAAVAIGGGDVAAGERVALRVGLGLVAIGVVVETIRRARRRSMRPAIAVFAAVALAVAAALAGYEMLSSMLIGPLIVGIAVRKAGVTARSVEQRLGVAVRRVGLPVFLGVAAVHTDLRALGSVLVPVIGLIVAVIALKVAAAYLAARTVGFASGDARAIAALMQCGGVMTIAISLETLHANVIDTRMHATLTVVGLATTIAVCALLPRAGRADRRAAAMRKGAPDAVTA